MNFIKNKYVRRAKISEYKFRKIVRCFVADMSATEISTQINLNRNTVNRYLNQIRERIFEFCEENSPFNNMRQGTKLQEKARGIGSRISSGLGLFKRKGKVCVMSLAAGSSQKLQSLMGNKSLNHKLVVHSIEESANLVAIGYDTDANLANKPSYVSNLEKFWNFAQERMAKFQGVAKHKLDIHLKECEFRFNFRNDDLYALVLKLISERPLGIEGALNEV